MTDENIKMAKQDIPWPDDRLPKGTTIVDDESAHKVITHQGYRPTQPILGDTALDTINESWSDRHAKMLITYMWRGIKAGSSLFVRPDFPAKPDAPAKRSHLEGYKQYTK